MKLEKTTAVILAIAGIVFLGFAVRVSFNESYSATATNTYKYIPFMWNRDADINTPSSKLHQRASAYRIKLKGESDSNSHMPNIKRVVEATSSQTLAIDGKTSVEENTMGTITLGGTALKESDIDELYCSDFNVALPGDSTSKYKNPNNVLYKKYNLEESGYFSTSDAARLRAIIQNSYPKKGASNAKKDIVAWCKNNSSKCSGYDEEKITSQRLLTGVQWAIWNIANSSSYCKNDTESELCDTGADLTLESTIDESNADSIRAIKNYYEALTPIPLNSGGVANGIISFGNIVSEAVIINGVKRVKVQIPVTSTGATLTDVNATFTVDGKEIKPTSSSEISNNTILYTLIVDAAEGTEVNVKVTAKQKGITGPFLYKPTNRKDAQILIGNSVTDTLNLEDSLTFKIPKENYTTLEIIKSVKGKDEELPAGVKIRITGPNMDETYVTEEGKSKIFTINSTGVYKIEELEAPDGYIKSDPVEIVITEADLTKGGTGVAKLVKIENDYTKVEFSKVDINSQEELPGARLDLYDEEGKLIKSWISTDKPYTIEMLKPGKYKLRETIAPEGYQLSTETVEFEIKETGEIQEVKFNNSPYVEVPKTLLNKSSLIYFIGGFVLLIGSGMIIYYVKKKNKKIS